MTETLAPVTEELDQRRLAEQLLAQAKAQGAELFGPNGLLNQLTKNVLKTALEAELTSTIRPAVMAGTPATAPGPTPC